jgi:UDP-glucuronate decarboxylase
VTALDDGLQRTARYFQQLVQQRDTRAAGTETAPTH